MGRKHEKDQQCISFLPNGLVISNGSGCTSRNKVTIFWEDCEIVSGGVQEGLQVIVGYRGQIYVGEGEEASGKHYDY